MNEYILFITKLRAMQFQKFPIQSVYDEWKLGHDKVVYSLKVDLTIAILTSDITQIKTIKNKITELKQLGSKIQQDLLEMRAA